MHDITRRDVLGLAAGLPLLALTPRRGSPDAPRATRPNVLFVFSDSQRAMDTGCYGSRHTATPALDAFAEQGVRVASCVSGTPVCRPFRASLMTGLVACRHGLLTNVSEHNRAVHGRQWDPGDHALLGRTFAAAGYRCGYVGKWHLGEVALDPGPLRFGFDDGWCAALKPAHDYRHWSYATGASTRLTGSGDFRPAFEREQALAFIDQDDERPWLCVLSWGPPHEPFEPPPGFQRTGRPALPANVFSPQAKAFARRSLPGYRGLIEALDQQFGLLLAALEQRGLSRDTLVVYTSDHGHQLGSHDLAGKEAPYEESLRVPLLLRWPGVLPAGRVHRGLVAGVDLFPTLAGLCGLEPPPDVDGLDLSFGLRRQSAPQPSPQTSPRATVQTSPRDSGHERGAVYISGYDTPFVAWPGWRGVRTPTRLFAAKRKRPWLLFDLEHDPLQLANLVHDDPERVEQLDALTHTLMERYGDSWGD